MTDSNGTEVVKYTYDAWGRVLSATGSLAATLGTVQPFRYRGYVYDVETGLYYLRARYYNPIWQRFVNADCLIAEKGFAYCSNNPLFFSDDNGTYELSAIDFKADSPGLAILMHYLFGNGEDMVFNDVGGWSEYMKHAPVCSLPCCNLPENTSLSEYTHSLLKPYGSQLNDGESLEKELTVSVSLLNGESAIGYNYLHGVNSSVGGFHINAIISRKYGYITYDVTCTWNDIMDPNYKYDSDSLKAEIAKSIPFASPTDFRIAITWKDYFIENVEGRSH